MAEPSRCPYCDEGILLWIWREEFNDYILQCTICPANGEYKIKKGKEALGREYRFVDATPNGDLPVRILSAYIEGLFTTDNTVGIPPENPLCKLMNETQEKRNTIIRKAIDALKLEDIGSENYID